MNRADWFALTLADRYVIRGPSGRPAYWGRMTDAEFDALPVLRAEYSALTRLLASIRAGVAEHIADIREEY
ncbi:MAG: hypothetical protein AB7Q37_18700 [Pyrinomonadaceae bacterium]